MIGGGLKPGDPIRGELDEVRKAGERAAALTRQLLAFSRQQVLQPRSLDLNQVVNGLEAMLKRLLGEDVELSLLTQRTLGQVRADPGQVEQVLMNLVVNARDAMTDGGTISIDTSSVAVGELLARTQDGVSPGPHILLSVSDNGSGIAADALSKIFDPFFTTKAPGRGTGLGLSTVYGIVRSCGGFVTVRSVVGAGTTFDVYFPEADPNKDVTAPAVRADAVSSSMRERERILLVEDDHAIRAMAARVLRRRGYTVIPAASAEDAIAVAAAEHQPIDLLLTDLVMPGANGLVLSETLAEMSSNLATLFTSGYPDRLVGSERIAENFIPKPYTPEVLLRGVRATLDARRGS
jgi:two-component system, cell cycle sensor histidine kinase and response regulator CckA